MSTLAFCIAGTHSGCGKTTVSLGVMAALVKRGFKVQPFKVGPDFIDPGHHRRITGRDSHNLDGWMLSREYNREIFSRYVSGADAAVIEGVMGLFDGFSGKDEAGSTAQMAKWLSIPVFLVIDARSMARSAAAVALGFSDFDGKLPLAGIIFNRVGSKSHAEMLSEAVGELENISVLGCLPREDGLEIPSRHLGLVTDGDFSIDEEGVKRLAEWVESNLDLDLMLKMTGKQVPSATLSANTKADIKIGVAMDEAFCFYYPENLRLLREAGADIATFSPMRAKHLPEGISGLIFGGGYPELHARALSENISLMDEIRAFGLEAQKPIYAECGGFMYLMNSISDLDGRSHPMVGIFPMRARMEKRLRALGYREIMTLKDSLLGPKGSKVRGHEFHYSTVLGINRSTEAIYSMIDRKSSSKGNEGFSLKRVLGSYVHLHWGSNPIIAEHFISYCRKYG